MKAVCSLYIKDTDDLKDVLQDGFIKVFEKIESFKYEHSLGGWIRTIIVNTALNFLRDNNKLNAVSFDEELDFTDETSNDNELDQLIGNLDGDSIHQAIAELETKFRLVFSMFYLEDLSHKEIASKLNITEQLSRVRLNRSKLALKEALMNIKY